MVEVIKDRELFRSIFESSMEGILVMDEQKNILRANPASENMFGYDTKELVGRNIVSLIPKMFKKNHTIYKEYLKDIKARSKDDEAELFGIKEDGFEFPIKISLEQSRINNKNVIIVFVTEINKTNDALYESDRKYTTLINKLPGFVYRSKNNKNWEMKNISEGCFSITGYTPNEFKEHKIYYGQIILKEDRDNVWNGIQNAISNKKPYNHEYHIRKKDGSIKNVLEQGEGVYDKNGKLEALEGFITDITKQKKIEQELRANEVRNKAILKAIPDFMFVLNKQGSYLDLHAPDSSKLILPKDELIGKNIYDVLPKEVCENIIVNFDRCEKTGKPQTMEYSLTINGVLKHFEVRIVLKENGRFLMVVRDVTSFKKEEKFKKQMQLALEMIAKHQPLGQIADQIVLTVQEQVQNCMASILLLDNEKETLHKLAASNLPKGFSNGIEGVTIGPTVGSCGTAAFFKKEIIVTDIENDPLWEDYKELALEHKLKACWAIPIFSSDHQVLGIFAIYSDHTRNWEDVKKGLVLAVSKLMGIAIEQHLAEKSLKENEERFRLAMLATHDGFYDFDPASKTGWYNQTYIDLFEPTDKKTWWEDNIHPSDKKKVLEEFNKILAGKGIHWKYEYRLKSNDGSYIYIEDHGYIVYNEQGKAIRMLGAVADITEQKKAEQKLRNYSTELEEKVMQRTHELEATVQQLVKSNLNLEDQIQITKVAESKALDSQTMFTAISKNFPKGIIVVVNSNFEVDYIEGEELEKMGLKDLALPGRNIDDIEFFSKKRKIKLKQDIRKTLAGKHLSFEIEFKKNTYSVNSTPLFDEDKRVKQALLVYSNISVQKQVELEILNALTREQELNELKSRFISLASHEFRTPLSAILSSATLIEKLNEPGMGDKRAKYAGKIKSNVRNLVVILNDFLSLSKLEEGKMSMQPEYFDVINFSKAIIQEIETNKKEGQVITIVNDYPSIEVNLDPKMIRHILSNLISNAIKYSPKDKEITLTIKRNNERIFLEVTDEGIGIPVEEHNNLFDRFFRARNASNIQGTGLGLHIVKQYSELIGGAISFKSKLLEGSTFIVELPINQNENEKSIID